MTQIFYDKESDVLYLSKGDPRPAISREIGDDILLRVDPTTEEIIGVTILNLAARFGSQTAMLPFVIDLKETH